MDSFANAVLAAYIVDGIDQLVVQSLIVSLIGNDLLTADHNKRVQAVIDACPAEIPEVANYARLALVPVS